MNRRPILIVEDEPELGRVLLEGLSENGYSLHLVENAEKALKLFKQKAFDLVVSDIRLPDMDGLQLLKHMKYHSVSTPVILMTGYGSVQNAVEAMKKGAYDYILNPFSMKALEGGIQKAFPRRLGGESPGDQRDDQRSRPSPGGAALHSPAHPELHFHQTQCKR